MSSDVIIDKDYYFLREAKGASNDVYYTKGDVELGRNLLWKSSSGSGSLVVVSYAKGTPVRISVIYFNSNPYKIILLSGKTLLNKII